MKWTTKPTPRRNECRYRTFFAFRPVRIGREVRWLEMVTVEQSYSAPLVGKRGWINNYFVDAVPQRTSRVDPLPKAPSAKRCTGGDGCLTAAVSAMSVDTRSRILRVSGPCKQCGIEPDPRYPMRLTVVSAERPE